MISAVLDYFPPYTHPLTLVSDPDGLLAEESILTALGERGFTLVDESDPVALRCRIEGLRPFRVAQPVVVVTAGRLEALPYDLWQQGRHVALSLHDFFPNLAYPVVRVLTAAQRWRLSQAPTPVSPLGRQSTIEHVLRHAFGADLSALEHPAALIAWLGDYHRSPDPMPKMLAEHLLAHLRLASAYASWPLEEQLADASAYTRFVQEQWAAYVGTQTGSPVREDGVVYVVDFESDPALQDAVPRLVRTGALAPVEVSDPTKLPAWARPAVAAEDENLAMRRAADLLVTLQELTAGELSDARWEQWQGIAWAWAALCALRYDPETRLGGDQQAACGALETLLDKAFPEWLRSHYAPLGAQRLPVPRHVYHVPHYLDFRRGQPDGAAQPLALLVMDGMSLADWVVIGGAWRARHPNSRLTEHLLLAQIPTITAVSRRALISGLRPADFASPLDANAPEAGQWLAFWAQRDFPASGCLYLGLTLDRGDPPPEIEDHRIRALCLVDDTVDGLAHSASLGAVSHQASLKLWLESSEGARKLEQVIAGLLGRGFSVYVASDHGHVEARGVGRPSEGLTVTTKGQRARVYADRRAALSVQQGFAETFLWSRDGLLPDGVFVLMPRGRSAFALANETVVTHGGPTLDEVVVPFVEMTQV